MTTAQADVIADADMIHAHSDIPGAIRITGQALSRLAACLVADSVHVAPRSVAVRLADMRGVLRVSVSMPAIVSRVENTTIVDEAARVRAAVIAGMDRLAGRQVGAVDVYFSTLEAAKGPVG